MEYELIYHTENTSFERKYNIAEQTVEELKPKVLKTLNTKGNIIFVEHLSEKVPLSVEKINSVTIKKNK